MFSAPTAHLLISLIVLSAILLMLVRPRRIPEFFWIALGVLLLLLLRLIPLPLAARAIAKGSDVYLFLIGMMLLSELAREHGLFDWLSALAVRSAAGSAARLFALIYAIGILVTVFMSNDATAVVLTPAILVAVRKAKIDPLPYLFACAFVANAASFLLPISNPANLVVFRTHLPPLAQWLASFALPSLVSIASTYLLLRWLFRASLRQPLAAPSGLLPLTSSARLVLAALAATVIALLAASALGRDLGLPTFAIAAAVTALSSISTPRNPLPLLRHISWSTLGLVAGLFVMVDAMVSIGILNLTHSWLACARSQSAAICALITGSAVAVANNFLNNLPLGLLASATLQSTAVSTLTTTAILIGIDLGPNLSITGSLATILWLIALRRANLNVSFLQFLKVGLIVMPISLLLTLLSALLLSPH